MSECQDCFEFKKKTAPKKKKKSQKHFDCMNRSQCLSLANLHTYTEKKGGGGLWGMVGDGGGMGVPV